MRIGMIKLGLKTYFSTTDKTKQGSGHELPVIWEIFKNNGHECFMVSNSDIYEPIEDLSNLDYLFVFNGFAPKTLNDTNMNMLKQPISMMKKINAFKGKILYFWTDPRYNPAFLPITKEMIILSQEKEHYAHLDKLILYKKELRPIILKDIIFAILMNWTEPKRAKNAIIICNVLKKYDPIIIGDWKKKLNEFLSHEVDSSNLQDLLDQVKYSWNQTTDPNWVSQKCWEMIISNVICFHYNSDIHNLAIPQFLKFNSVEQIKKVIEGDEYNEILRQQQLHIKPEYLNGTLIYKTIMSKL